MSSVPKVLAVIPARSGSAGVSNKNLLNIAGKSMLERSLDHLRASRFDIDVIVVTNDPLFKKAALAAGLKVVDEPEEMAQPDVSAAVAVRYGVCYAMEHFGMIPDCVVETFVNAPVRPSSFVDREIQMFVEFRPDAIFPICAVGARHHPLKMWNLGDDGRVVRSFPGISAVSRQLAEPYYTLVGPPFLYSTQALLSWQGDWKVAPYSEMSHVRGLEIGPNDIIEIDTPEDLSRATAAILSGLPEGVAP